MVDLSGSDRKVDGCPGVQYISVMTNEDRDTTEGRLHREIRETSRTVGCLKLRLSQYEADLGNVVHILRNPKMGEIENGSVRFARNFEQPLQGALQVDSVAYPSVEQIESTLKEWKEQSVVLARLKEQLEALL